MKSKFLITVPEKKVQSALANTIRNCSECGTKKVTLNNCCERCRTFNKAIKRYAESNIPVAYWKLGMNKFIGEQILLDKYNEIIENIPSVYEKGVYICYAGNHGIGKTMTCANILMRAAEKGYECLYVTLSDIVDNIVTNFGEDKIIARDLLLKVDFLVIDEFDSRYIGSDSASDLYGRVLENIFRTRVQNKLPIFMSTNSPNILDTFNGPIKQSIASLMNYVEIIPVLGEDFRKQKM